jgi:hypothetical protein
VAGQAGILEHLPLLNERECSGHDCGQEGEAKDHLSCIGLHEPSR